MVRTPEGQRPIGEIRQGDTVLAYDHQVGEWCERQVEKFHESIYEGPLLTVHTDGGQVRTTIYHPFWVLSGRDLDERSAPRELEENEDEGLSLPGRWVNSHELRCGDVLIGQDGQQRTVLRIEQEFVSAFLVHNLTIGDDHTFAVGADGVLVHNTADCAPKAKQAALEDMRREDALLDPHDAEFYGGDGEVYRVPGADTPSKRPYIGSANDKLERARTARDGRDRSNAVTIDRFPVGDTAARRAAEQRAIDDNGGLSALDNLRNEIAK